MLKNRETYEIMTPESVGVKKTSLVMGKHSGRHAFKDKLSDLGYADVTDDVVQSRIIWLSGMEEGINQGPGVDSFDRYIYIHGTPEEWLLGQKASKGCIRMANSDVIELFDLLSGGEIVYINKY